MANRIIGVLGAAAIGGNHLHQAAKFIIDIIHAGGMSGAGTTKNTS
ncbi:hypothetical protein CFter6_2708 [Collimonas fungivorans]|uniref:Uncharacterized protein n=1 Tax=Collimonas fungivorans TaxID=158899 RepID=A0A127PC26_9BURK|nr:hypothetical protein CFter6_2708 [Collimonas fungivorans]